MANHRGALMSVLLAAAVLAAVSETASGATCSDMVKPCLNYMRVGGPTVPQPCCNGIRSLAAARTALDKEITCLCFKTATLSGGARYAAGLARKCNANIPYGPNTDCSKIR